MRGLADLADGAGYLGDAIGGLLGGPAGKMVKQAGDLLHLAGDALNWFAENVLDPIVDALTLPEGIRSFIPSLRDPLILDLDGLGVSLTSLSGSPAGELAVQAKSGVGRGELEMMIELAMEFIKARFCRQSH